MRAIGLTGSMAMGKTTVARLFAKRGIPVHDSDSVVHALYADDAVPAIAAEFPDSVVAGAVDRSRLAKIIARDPAAISRLEAIVHPLVARHREAFIAAARNNMMRMILLDIPLLFEAGLADTVDTVIVVSAPQSVQAKRIMARAGMTEEKMIALLSRQVPDSEKRRRAHFIVDTGRELAFTERQVAAILRAMMYTR